VKLAKTRGSSDQSLTVLAEKLNKHVADVMLDLAARGRARHRVSS